VQLHQVRQARSPRCGHGAGETAWLRQPPHAAAAVGFQFNAEFAVCAQGPCSGQQSCNLRESSGSEQGRTTEAADRVNPDSVRQRREAGLGSASSVQSNSPGVIQSRRSRMSDDFRFNHSWSDIPCMCSTKMAGTDRAQDAAKRRRCASLVGQLPTDARLLQRGQMRDAAETSRASEQRRPALRLRLLDSQAESSQLTPFPVILTPV
jgi:hypothetical protein